VLAADRAQDARVGRVAGLALAARRQLELLEQDPRDLLRRAEHELLARELVRLRLELLDPVASRAVISPIRYVSILTPTSSIATSTAVSGSSIVAVELLVPALAHALEQRLAQPARGRGVRTSAAVSSSAPARDELDAVLGARSSSSYGARRARSGTRRSSCRRPLDAQRLGVVRDELAVERSRPRPDDTPRLRSRAPRGPLAREPTPAA
jgi:hypothetical protein